jgi:murein DD-endopeptidase MepM/ murein hydrolase activator NlpD
MAFAGVLLWFNPFVFLLLRSVRENHEYLADDFARNKPDTLASYLFCLREETIRHYSPAVASYFKSSTIKKRIIMLTNHHTKNQKRWRYIAVLPLIALILLAFQAPVDPELYSPAKVSTQISDVSEAKPAAQIPSIFPLPEKYREKITWDHGVTAINPISKKEVTHQGVDIAAPKGTAVYSSSAGEVIKAELLEGWGNLIILEHAEGYTSHYAHLEGFKVKAGDKVTRGQLIATVGSTGRSTGPHLHYEVRKGGEKLNPADYY